jgi:hypothetical protein
LQAKIAIKTRILDYDADEFALKPTSGENVVDKVFNLLLKNTTIFFYLVHSHTKDSEKIDLLFILYRTVIIHTIYLSSRQKILVIDDEFDNALTIKCS